MSAKPPKRRLLPDDSLPEFDRPPLAEVVLGIQFDPLVGMSAAHLGTIWGLFRNRFPRTEDKQPIASTFERFESPRETSAEQWNLDLMVRPIVPRCWFINEAGNELLQLQQDRFHHNWRKVESQPMYPRYSHLRESFEAEGAALQNFVAKERLGELTPNQCEITYINHMPSDENWSEHREAGKLFRLLSDAGAMALPQAMEHVRFDTAFLMKDDQGAACGRLHVSIASGFLTEDSTPMFAMTLTARGAPLGPGLDGALKFLDLGHRWIVRSFTELTTDPMHKTWGMKTR